MTTFRISIYFNWRTYSYNVEHSSVDGHWEQFKIIAANKIVILHCDRPFWRRKGLMKRRPTWKVIVNNVSHGDGLEKLKDAILKVIDS